MARALGGIIKVLGFVTLAVAGVWSLILDLIIINHAVGFWGFVAAFLLFPVCLAATPWYALVALGMPGPLIIGYGGGLLGWGLVALGSALSGD